MSRYYLNRTTFRGQEKAVAVPSCFQIVASVLLEPPIRSLPAFGKTAEPRVAA